MTESELYRLRFPIGPFKKPSIITQEHIDSWINDIRLLPQELRKCASALSSDELNITYRPKGWNTKQIIHHLADSHMNSWIRFKLALTEDTPSIRPYAEDIWAEQTDYQHTPIQLSLDLLTALHARWALLLESLSNNDLKRKFHHPESNQYFTLDENIGIYAWHGKHHLAHIQLILDRI